MLRTFYYMSNSDMLYKCATQGTMIVVMQMVKKSILGCQKMLRPDFIGIPLRFTRDDDSSNAVGYTNQNLGQRR